jgi:hypothetical protein
MFLVLDLENNIVFLHNCFDISVFDPKAKMLSSIKKFFYSYVDMQQLTFTIFIFYNYRFGLSKILLIGLGEINNRPIV